LSSGKSGSKCAPTTETVPRPRASRSAASSACSRSTGWKRDARAGVDRAHHCHQADGAEADDADEVVLAHPAARDDGVIGGRQVVGEEHGRLVRDCLRER
jgi:hypothetical protein